MVPCLLNLCSRVHCRPKDVDSAIADGLNIRDVDLNGDTALHISARAGVKNIVIHLLHIADDLRDKVNNDGHTPFDVSHPRCYKAFFNHELEIIRTASQDNNVELFRRSIVPLKYYNLLDTSLWISLFHIAAEHGSVSILNHLLSNDFVGVNAQGFGGCTALHFAVHSRSYKSIYFLLNYGANINVVDDFGNKAMETTEDKFCLRLLGAPTKTIRKEIYEELATP